VANNFFRKLNTTVSGGAIIIAFFSIISKILGLLRDRLLASQFGAGAQLDIYFAAFKIPDFIFNILILGALSVAFIPIFQKAYNKDAQRGLEISQTILTVLLVIVGSLAVVAAIFMYPLIRLLVPGFTADQLQQTVQLTRILLVAILFFTASNVMSGVLNAWNRFLTFSISSVLYNIGIIIGIIVLYPLFGLYGLALGVVLGSAAHFFVQFGEARRLGWRFKISFKIVPEVKRIFRLMIPRMIGTGATQFNLVFITSLASQLPQGSLSIFNLASNLQSFPSSIFGVSLAVASFPHITKFASENNHEAFQKIFSLQFRRILYFIIPISVLIVILRAQLVRVILGSGSFDWEDTLLTANALGIFALSIFAQGLIPLVSQAFYAHEDTRTPMIVGLISTVFNSLLAIPLAHYYGVLGLTAAFSIASIATLVSLAIILHIRIKAIPEIELFGSLVRIGLAACVAGLIAYASLFPLSHLVDTHTFVGIFIQGFVAGVIGLISYALITLIANFPEIAFAQSYFKKYLRQLKSLFSSS
jgi:putative peptidoglycan lipid II flippase